MLDLCPLLLILTSLPSKADPLVFLATGGHSHLLLVVVETVLVLLHHEALLELVPPLLLLPRHPAVRPAVPLAEPALRPALLAVFSDQRLQLLPGQLLLLRQDRPGLAGNIRSQYQLANIDMWVVMVAG